MSFIVKAFLLLVAVVCISEARPGELGQNCLCQSVLNSTTNLTVMDIQIYPATIFCNKVEIVASTGSGRRFCLDPQSPEVKSFVVRIIRNKRNAKKMRSQNNITSTDN